MNSLEIYAPTIVILLGIVALVSAFMSLVLPLLYLHIPAGAAEYVHFTQEEITLRILTIAYFLIIAGIDLFVAIGFFARFDKARKIALILAPFPFIGAVLQAIGLSASLLGANLFLETVGISFPALGVFLVPYVLTVFSGLTSGWISIVILWLLLSIGNLLLIPFLTRKEVKTLFQRRKPATQPPSTPPATP